MLRIANSFLWHKKSSYFLIFIISISLALMLLIVPLFDGIITSVQSSNINRYGSHHIAMFGIDKETLDGYLKDSPIPIDAEGCIHNYGNYSINGTENTLTIGHFDEAAYEVGNIELLDGHMPNNKNEIAVEQTALYYISEQAKIGDTLSIDVGGNLVSLRICGILFDYSNRWNTPMPYKRGFSDFPQGIVTKDGFASTSDTPIWLVRFALEGDPFDNSVYAQFFYDTFFPNDGTFNEVFAENENARDPSFFVPFGEFQDLYLIVLLIGTCVAIATGIAFHFAGYRKTYQTLYGLGAEGEYPWGLYSVQSIYTLAISVIIAIGLAYGISAIVSLITGEISYTILHKNSFVWPAITLLCTLLFMELYFVFYIQPMRKLSSSQYHSNKPIKNMRIRGGVTFSLFRSFLRQNWLKTMAAVLMIAVLTAALCVSIPQIGQLTRAGEEDPMFPDFTLYADFSSNLDYRFNLKGYWPHKSIPIDPVLTLDNNEAVELTQVYLPTNVSLVLANSTPYWHTIAASSSFIYDAEGNILGKSEEFIPYEVNGAPNAAITPGVAFYLLTDTALQALQSLNPSIKGDLQKNQVLAIFPPISENMAFTFNNIGLKEDLYRTGDTLRLGYLEYADYMDVIEQREIATYQEDNSLQIGEIVKDMDIDPFSRLGGAWASMPIFFVSPETAKENSLFTGAGYIDAYLKKPTTPAEYESAKLDFVRMGLSVSNADISIIADEIHQNKLLGEAINTSCMMLFFVFGIFCFSTFYAVMYLSLLKRRRSLGIYRSLGMKKRSLFLALYIELLVYWLLAMLLSMALCIPAGMHVNMWMMDLDEIPQFFPYVGYVAIAGIVLCAIIVWSLVRKVYKESIASSIRISD